MEGQLRTGEVCDPLEASRVGSLFFTDVQQAQLPEAVQQRGLLTGLGYDGDDLHFFNHVATSRSLFFGDLAPDDGGSLLVAQVDADDADVFLGLGDLDLFKEVDPLGRDPQLLLQKLRPAAKGLGLGVQSGNLLELHHGGVHPEGVVAGVVVDLPELEGPEHRHDDAGDVLLAADHALRLHQVLELVGHGPVFGEDGNPVVQPVDGGGAACLQLLQLGAAAGASPIGAAAFSIAASADTAQSA